MSDDSGVSLSLNHFVPELGQVSYSPHFGFPYLQVEANESTQAREWGHRTEYSAESDS